MRDRLIVGQGEVVPGRLLRKNLGVGKITRDVITFIKLS